MIKILQDAGITGWKTNYRVAGYRVDFGFPAPRVALEVDGMAFHIGADEFQIDRERQNAIVLAGWQVLRFTWLDLTEYPERVAAVVRAAISAR
jgi:very-short-patch-repair endonuclease